MKYFDNYTLDDCSYKILEEAAEVYAAWQELYKDGCECGLCDLANSVDNDCPDNLNLGDELYDVLQVCVNISALIGDTNSFDGRIRGYAINKDFMQRFMSYVAYVHVLTQQYDGSTLDQNNINSLVNIVAGYLMEIANAYGIDMSKAAERGTQRNIERGRISEDA
jgi:NTP pyrophosphatase (non-canonical NTP hydrolase)